MNHPKNIAGQLDFLGIFPGKTTQNEVVDLVSSPNSTSIGDTYETWSYDEFDIDFSNKIVDRIIVYQDIPKLNWFVESYGCPDVIIHFEMHPEAGESSNYISLAYFKAGMELNNIKLISGIPVLGFEDSPTSVLYVKSYNSLQDYLLRNGYDLSTDFVKIIDFADAIK